jgi:hypothetical protein
MCDVWAWDGVGGVLQREVRWVVVVVVCVWGGHGYRCWWKLLQCRVQPEGHTRVFRQILRGKEWGELHNGVHAMKHTRPTEAVNQPDAPGGHSQVIFRLFRRAKCTGAGQDMRSHGHYLDATNEHGHWAVQEAHTHTHMHLWNPSGESGEDE